MKKFLSIGSGIDSKLTSMTFLGEGSLLENNVFPFDIFLKHCYTAVIQVPVLTPNRPPFTETPTEIQ